MVPLALWGLLSCQLSACGPSLEVAITRSLARHREVLRRSPCDNWQLYKVASVPDESWLESYLTRIQIDHLLESQQLWLAACVAPETPFDERMLEYGGVEMLAVTCVAGPDSCGVVARAPYTGDCLMTY